MPTVYAHWYFGDKCLQQMPENLLNIIHENRDYYNLGVHGPDIFFYNLFDKKCTSYGSNIHFTPARLFFEKALYTYHRTNEKDKDKLFAYILGFLTHFVLDSTCHSYIYRKQEVSNISHNLIETCFEKYLMQKDGRQFNLVDRSEFLKPSFKKANVISKLFNVSFLTVYTTIKMQRIIIRNLNCISKKRHDVLFSILTKYELYDYRDLLLPLDEVADCMDSNIRLDKLFNVAYKRFKDILESFLKAEKGNGHLADYFKHDFEKWPDYQDIKVLSYDKELKYIVE